MRHKRVWEQTKRHGMYFEHFKALQCTFRCLSSTAASLPLLLAGWLHRLLQSVRYKVNHTTFQNGLIQITTSHVRPQEQTLPRPSFMELQEDSEHGNQRQSITTLDRHEFQCYQSFADPRTIVRFYPREGLPPQVHLVDEVIDVHNEEGIILKIQRHFSLSVHTEISCHRTKGQGAESYKKKAIYQLETKVLAQPARKNAGTKHVHKSDFIRSSSRNG